MYVYVQMWREWVKAFLSNFYYMILYSFNSNYFKDYIKKILDGRNLAKIDFPVINFLHRIWFLLFFFSKDFVPTVFITLKFNGVAQRSPTTLPSRLSFSWGPPYRPLQSSSQPPPPVLRIQIYFISDFFLLPARGGIYSHHQMELSC